MTGTPPAPGDLRAQVRETHTGVVFLVGDRAFKAKKPVVTDFLDFSTVDNRERACAHEVALNQRLAPDSYLGVAHFHGPDGPAEPVIVMRRHPDSARLSTLVSTGAPVRHHLAAIAELLARFHERAARSQTIDTHGTVGAVSGRWQQNLAELQHYDAAAVDPEVLREIVRLSSQFTRGRAALFGRRVAERRIVDGHADLLTDDIFCLPDGPQLLDCLEFDDHLRYVDGVDDAAFLAMDLEFLGRRDLADHFLAEYCRRAGDPAPRSLLDFYIAYRAVVRAKVDCVRMMQGHREAAADARRHLDIAAEHVRAATVRLVIVGGGPGTGKTTLSAALAEQIGAQVLSTDEVRRELQRRGVIGGAAGDLDAGLYAPENVAIVYDEVLRRAQLLLTGGTSVILDGTWRDGHQRERARRLAAETATVMVELTCALPVQQAAARVAHRPPSASDATPQIAAALAAEHTPGGHPIDTSRPLADSVAEAQQICCLAI